MQTVSEAAAYPTIYQPNPTLCFLTGKAGTGKTTFLKEIIATTHKNTVVVALRV
jgi:ABC-type ATPase involved in cell division